MIKWRKSSLEVQNGGYFFHWRGVQAVRGTRGNDPLLGTGGLISPCKGANRYRAYGPRELAEIADVIFLRSSGVPVKKILQLRRFDLEQYQGGLRQMEEHMQRHLDTCQRICGQIQKQMANTQEILRLQREPYQPEEVPFEKIARFDFHEQEKLRRYSSDPTLYVRYFDTRDMSGTETRCIVMPPEASGPDLCWERSTGGTFLTFLIREQVDRDYHSDVWESVKEVQKRRRTGILLAQYLLTAVEQDERTDFLKGYIQVC